MTITLASILGLGFFLGMRHASDADHVIAISTLVSRQRSIGAAAVAGVFWGIGHSLTILLVGGAMVLFGVVIPERLGLGLELGVALMLIGLGFWTLKGTLRRTQETIAAECPEVAHSHGDLVHTHPFTNPDGGHRHKDGSPSARWLDKHFGRIRFYQAIRPCVIGIVHGLAGSAAVTLLVLPVIHDPVWAMAYLAIFGAGTIAGMLLITAVIAVPFLFTPSESHPLHRWMGAGTGALSVAFGLVMVYQIGFVNGLFR